MYRLICSVYKKFEGKNAQAMVLFAGMLPMLLGGVTLAVEVGYVHMARSQMQAAADSAALAAVRELVNDDTASARTHANQAVAANTVAGETITADPADIVFGRWVNNAFTPGTAGANAVQVTLRKTSGSANGALDLYFARVLGMNDVDITVSSIANLADIDLALVLDRSGSMDDDTTWSCGVNPDVGDNGNGGSGSGGSGSGGGGSGSGGGGSGSGGGGGGGGGGSCPPVSTKEPFESMRTAAKSFVNDLDGAVDQVSMISYATDASSPIEQQLTSTLNAVTNAIDGMDDPAGWTHLGDGILEGINELTSARARDSAMKFMILLSDGEPTCNSGGSCSSNSSTKADGAAYSTQMADLAAANDIVIHTISLGAGADRTLMQDIASRTGGSEFYATSGTDLSAVFDQIRDRLPVRLVN